MKHPPLSIVFAIYTLLLCGAAGIAFGGCTAKSEVERNATLLSAACDDLGGMSQWTLTNGDIVTEFSCIVRLPVTWFPNTQFKNVPPLGDPRDANIPPVVRP